MGETTGIAWTDHTFNPWIGCERVSPACAHCYADTLSKRMGLAVWGADSPRKITTASWKNPPKWNAQAEHEGRRHRVFCASLADVFEQRPDLEEPRDRLFELIHATPYLDWQILTKRPEAMRDYLLQMPLLGALPLLNVWVGTSIENMRYTYRADVLREIPAVVRFISAEPLLGSLFNDSRPLVQSVSAELTVDDDATGRGAATRGRAPLDLTDIHWVIAGGESGPGHRPMNVEHARELRDACLTFCRDCTAMGEQHAHGGNGFHDDHTHWAECLRPAFFFKQHGGATPKSGGKQLDGREWCEMPEPELVAA